MPLPEYDITGNGDDQIYCARRPDCIWTRGNCKWNCKLSKKETEILTLLSEDPAYTYQNLADKLNIGRKAVFGRIKNLKEKGIIERIGSDKNGYWQINE